MPSDPNDTDKETEASAVDEPSVQDRDMVIPSTPDDFRKADKASFIDSQIKELPRLCAHGLSPDTIESLKRGDDKKYFFIALKSYQLDKLEYQINSIHKEMCRWNDLTTPAKKDLSAIMNREPLGLFQVLRLNVAFKSPKLSDGIKATLTQADLHEGLREDSIVPSLRLVDGKILKKIQEQNGASYTKIAEHLPHQGQSGVVMLKMLANGYGGGTATRQRMGKYRITSYLASHIRRALCEVATNSADIPDLDELFPYYPHVHNYGYRSGSQPLPVSAGNLLP